MKKPQAHLDQSEMLHRARRLRRDATFPERLQWSKLRNQQVAGLKFRRQVPVGDYIVDFYCAEKMLAIELDGASHNNRKAYDSERQKWLEQQGLNVIRFSNDDVLNEINGVLSGILRACGLNVTGSPHPIPLPE